MQLKLDIFFLQAFYFLESSEGLNIIKNIEPPFYKNAVVQLVVFNVLFWSTCIAIHVQWIILVTEDEVPLKYFLCHFEMNSLISYYIAMMVFIRWKLMSLIKVRYNDLNRMMLEVSGKKVHGNNVLSRIRKIDVIYYNLQQVFDCFNKIFRIQNWLAISFGFLMTLKMSLYISNYPHQQFDWLTIVISVVSISHDYIRRTFVLLNAKI